MEGPKRQRRTAEQAKKQILDAAERRLAEAGPDGIRLQQIAADVGVSHPAILHHFGNREGLIQEVVQRAVGRLQTELIRSLGEVEANDEAAANEMLDHVFRTFSEKGHARILAWLILSGHQGESTDPSIQIVAQAAHERRKQRHDQGAHYEDTLFRTLLVAFALFGDAVAGPGMRASAGIGDDGDAPRRFREWLAKLLTEPRDHRERSEG